MNKMLLTAMIGIITVLADVVYAANPSGFSSANIVVTAQVGAVCQEAQHGAFPNPIIIDTQSVSDQTFAVSTDEKVSCTNGTVFTIKVTSGNGTAMNQNCTSSGVSSMAMKSTASPTDAIPYTLMCAGDTDGQGHFTGAGFNTPRSLGMSLKVLAADAQAAIAHADYSDSVTLTISY